MLQSISPADGRYHKQTKELAPIFSEMGLMRFRVVVEGEYLIALSELFNSPPARGGVRGGGRLRKLSDREKKLIRSLYNLSATDAQIISDIETKGYKNVKATDHDVKATEYFIKDKLAGASLKNVLEWVHFGLTSEDVNNLAYALMLRDGLSQVLIPTLDKIYGQMMKLAKQNARVAILSRTHGQPATPTTFGKEFRIFAERLKKQSDILQNIGISAKLNGATGNYNAHIAAFPKIDWIKFSQKFISQLNALSPATYYLLLTTNLHTTQIESHDSYAEIFDNLRRINTVLIDFSQDAWRYISDGWLKQKNIEGEVGSSTMPHKINPIKFENSEGNLGLANALFNYFACKLPISRLQRDMSDSTVKRNFGQALAYCLIGYKYLLNGLARISVDKTAVKKALVEHPEILAEPIQTVLRRESVPMPYEQLKALTRGKAVTLKDLHKFIDSLDVSNQIKKELKKFTPENYIGLAEKLAKM